MGLSFVVEGSCAGGLGRLDQTHTPQLHVTRSIFRNLKLESSYAIHPEWEALAIIRLIPPNLSSGANIASLPEQEPQT